MADRRLFVATRKGYNYDDHSRVGANSVVVKDVPAHSVVVGVPGRVRSRRGELAEDAQHEDLEHNMLHDTTMELLQQMRLRLAAVEQNVARLDSDFDVQSQLEGDGYDGPWGI